MESNPEEVNTLTEEELKELKEQFLELDKERDGYISRKEFLQFLPFFNYYRLTSYFYEVIAQKTGRSDSDLDQDFKKIEEEMKIFKTELLSNMYFSTFDSNNDGYLTFEEFKGKDSEDLISEITKKFLEVDKNSNKYISKKEFQNYYFNDSNINTFLEPGLLKSIAEKTGKSYLDVKEDFDKQVDEFGREKVLNMVLDAYDLDKDGYLSFDEFKEIE
ncbi:MAG: EF-hand domain-containing protein [Fischerella sp. CENA71]|nr:EF-hand domain-containing protein [Fischerella sp. CENA71]